MPTNLLTSLQISLAGESWFTLEVKLPKDSRFALTAYLLDKALAFLKATKLVQF